MPHLKLSSLNVQNKIFKWYFCNWPNITFFLSFSLLIDWLTAFHLELLQATLFVAVSLSAPVFLATCFKYYSQGLPTTFFPYIAPSRMFTENTLCLIIYALSISDVHFVRFLKVIFLLSLFERLPHLLVYLSILFLIFLSSSMF